MEINNDLSSVIENFTESDIDNSNNLFQQIEHRCLSSLYQNFRLPKSTIQELILHNVDYTMSIAEVLRNTIEPTENTRDAYTKLLNYLEEPFSALRTETQRLNYLEKNKTLILPEKIFLGQRLDEKNINGILQRVPVSVNYSYIPMSQTFKVLFEQPGVKELATTYLNKIVDDRGIEDIHQSKLWLEKKMFW